MWKKLGGAISRRLITNRRLALLVDQRLQKVSRPATPGGVPNNAVGGNELRELRALHLSVKALGQALAQSRQALLESIPAPAPTSHHLISKPCTQEDIQSSWLLYWCDALGHARRFHRRVWEAGYVMQVLHEAGALKRDAKVANLGGMDEIASYMSAMNCQVTMWPAGAARLIDELPDEHDSVWSRSILNRCQSIEEAQEFLLASARALRPGGVAVHVFDFNLDSTGPTFLQQGVIPQQRHIETFRDVLEIEDYAVAPLSFDCGRGPLDRYFDVPPFEAAEPIAAWANDGWPAHLKLSVNGLLVTSYGLTIQRLA